MDYSKILYTYINLYVLTEFYSNVDPPKKVQMIHTGAATR